MKRDWDLIRKILIATEELSESNSILEANAISDYSSDIVNYHYWLLDQAGLVKAIDASTTMTKELFVISLTWEGHELLDKTRQESAWIKVKNIIMNKGLDLSYEALKVALGIVITNRF